MISFGDLCASAEFDEDDELRFQSPYSINVYVGRSDVRRLRDHLTAVLGDAPTPTPDVLAEVIRAARDVAEAADEYRGHGVRASDAFHRFAAKLSEGR